MNQPASSILGGPGLTTAVLVVLVSGQAVAGLLFSDDQNEVCRTHRCPPNHVCVPQMDHKHYNVLLPKYHSAAKCFPIGPGPCEPNPCPELCQRLDVLCDKLQEKPVWCGLRTYHCFTREAWYRGKIPIRIDEQEAEEKDKTENEDTTSEET